MERLSKIILHGPSTKGVYDETIKLVCVVFIHPNYGLHNHNHHPITNQECGATDEAADDERTLGDQLRNRPPAHDAQDQKRHGDGGEEDDNGVREHSRSEWPMIAR